MRDGQRDNRRCQIDQLVAQTMRRKRWGMERRLTLDRCWSSIDVDGDPVSPEMPAIVCADDVGVWLLAHVRDSSRNPLAGPVARCESDANGLARL